MLTKLIVVFHFGGAVQGRHVGHAAASALGRGVGVSVLKPFMCRVLVSHSIPALLDISPVYSQSQMLWGFSFLVQDF